MLLKTTLVDDTKFGDVAYYKNKSYVRVFVNTKKFIRVMLRVSHEKRFA